MNSVTMFGVGVATVGAMAYLTYAPLKSDKPFSEEYVDNNPRQAMAGNPHEDHAPYSKQRLAVSGSSEPGFVLKNFNPTARRIYDPAMQSAVAENKRRIQERSLIMLDRQQQHATRRETDVRKVGTLRPKQHRPTPTSLPFSSQVKYTTRQAYGYGRH